MVPKEEIFNFTEVFKEDAYLKMFHIHIYAYMLFFYYYIYIYIL